MFIDLRGRHVGRQGSRTGVEGGKGDGTWGRSSP